MFKEYQTLTQIQGPLLIVKNIEEIKYAELAEITLSDKSRRFGKVLDVSHDLAVVQVFEGTRGLDVDKSKIRFLGRTETFGVSKDILGRVFNGRGVVRDDLPSPKVERILDINGSPINPVARDYPQEFISGLCCSIWGNGYYLRRG